MPLAHTPFRPRPQVQLLQSKSITVETAAAAFPAALQEASSTEDHRYQLPGSALISYKSIPAIAESLQADWLHITDGKRPSDCFVEVRGLLETHMHPCFLGEDKLRVGLQGAVGALLLHFSAVLRCVPLCFTRLRPAGTLAAVVGESPYVHFLADFTAIGFAPMVGHRLIGRASDRQTQKGINLSILNCFNTFVWKRNLPEEVSFDKGKSAWVHGRNDESLTLGDPIWVEVVSGMNSSSPVPSLSGTISWPPWVAVKASKAAKKRERSESAMAATSSKPSRESSFSKRHKHTDDGHAQTGVLEQPPKKKDITEEEERDARREERRRESRTRENEATEVQVKHGVEDRKERKEQKDPKEKKHHREKTVEREEPEGRDKKEKKEKKVKNVEDWEEQKEQKDQKEKKHLREKTVEREEHEGKDKKEKKEKKEKHVEDREEQKEQKDQKEKKHHREKTVEREEHEGKDKKEKKEKKEKHVEDREEQKEQKDQKEKKHHREKTVEREEHEGKDTKEKKDKKEKKENKLEDLKEQKAQLDHKEKKHDKEKKARKRE